MRLHPYSEEEILYARCVVLPNTQNPLIRFNTFKFLAKRGRLIP